MDANTTKRLAEIRQRAEAATRPPWIVQAGAYGGVNWLVGSFLTGYDEDGNDDYSVHVTTDSVHASQYESNGAKADAEFIANSRLDIPYLLDLIQDKDAEIEKLNKELLERDFIWLPEKDAEIERLRGALEEIAKFPDGYWIGEANLDRELSKRRGIARSALEGPTQCAT